MNRLRLACFVLLLIGFLVLIDPQESAAQSACTLGSAVYEGTISAGVTVQDTVETSCGDSWWFYGYSGDSVTISIISYASGSASYAFDTYLELYDAAGNRITYNDDGGDGLNSLISSYPLYTSGDYYIVARGFSSGIGPYSLTLSVRGGTGAIVPTEADWHSCTFYDAVYVGRVNYGNSYTYYNDRMCGYAWDFYGSAGDSITIELLGSDYDTYLDLYDNSGGWLASDDDAATNLSAGFYAYTLPYSGYYYFVGRGYFGRSGSYAFYLYGGSTPAPTGPSRIATATPFPTALPPVQTEQVLPSTGRLDTGDSGANEDKPPWGLIAGGVGAAAVAIIGLGVTLVMKPGRVMGQSKIAWERMATRELPPTLCQPPGFHCRKLEKQPEATRYHITNLRLIAADVTSNAPVWQADILTPVVEGLNHGLQLYRRTRNMADVQGAMGQVAVTVANQIAQLIYKEGQPRNMSIVGHIEGIGIHFTFVLARCVQYPTPHWENIKEWERSLDDQHDDLVAQLANLHPSDQWLAQRIAPDLTPWLVEFIRRV